MLFVFHYCRLPGSAEAGGVFGWVVWVAQGVLWLVTGVLSPVARVVWAIAAVLGGVGLKLLLWLVWKPLSTAFSWLVLPFVLPLVPAVLLSAPAAAAEWWAASAAASSAWLSALDLVWLAALGQRFLAAVDGSGSVVLATLVNIFRVPLVWLTSGEGIWPCCDLRS